MFSTLPVARNSYLGAAPDYVFFESFPGEVDFMLYYIPVYCATCYCILTHSALFYYILLYSTILYCILLYSVKLYFMLLLSTIFYSATLHFTLLSQTPLDSFLMLP